MLVEDRNLVMGIEPVPHSGGLLCYHASIQTKNRCLAHQQSVYARLLFQSSTNLKKQRYVLNFEVKPGRDVQLYIKGWS